MNRLPILSDSEFSLLANALFAAAEQYDRDAAQNRRPGASDERLAQQFERQAAEARALADKLEEESEDA